MGTAWSNYGTAALSETALTDILVAMGEMVDGKGQKILIKPDKLIVPVELENSARILMETTGRTGGNHNDVNVLKGKFDIFVWNWLTDANNYFVLDSKLSAENGLKFFWRRRPKIKRDDKASNDSCRWYSTSRYSLGWVDPRSIYGGIVA